MVKRQSREKRVPVSELRIIGGSWRGRKLPIIALEGLRPTPDRVRETLFNWLAPELAGARCLDLFAGSGALGLEALSRGAASVVLVDYNHTVSQQLAANIARLQARNAEVVNARCEEWLRQNMSGKPVFDIVFVDPPYRQDLIPGCLDALQRGNWLREGACIYIESSSDEPAPVVPANWRPHRQKKAGQVSYSLYYREDSALLVDVHLDTIAVPSGQDSTS